VNISSAKTYIIAMRSQQAVSVINFYQGTLEWYQTVARQQKNHDLADVLRENMLIGK
jgi:hypothetical protein